MFKKTKKISINIIVALFVLLSLLCVSIGVGHAWFTTSQNKGVEVVIRVNEYNLSLYQLTTVNEVETSTEVYTYKKNNRENESKYIILDKQIIPNQFNDLKLKLKNNDAGAGVYVKYQLKLFSVTANAKTEIPINITLGENFKQNGNYFYYATESANLLLSNSAEVILLTGFTVPYSSFASLQGGETVMLELTIECCETSVGF